MVKNSQFSTGKRPEPLDLAKRSKTELSATLRRRGVSTDDDKGYPMRRVLTADRRNSTVLHVERLHAEHLESERRLQEEHARRGARQRRHTEQRVQARAQLRRSKALSKVEIFRHLDGDAIGELIEKMSYSSPPVGTKVVCEGDIADALYVIVKGECGVYQQREDGSEGSDPGSKIGVLSDLDVFGESALMETGGSGGAALPAAEPPRRSRRNATVIVEAERTQLLKLSRVAFDALFASGRLLHGEQQNVLGRVRTTRMSRMKRNTDTVVKVNVDGGDGGGAGEDDEEDVSRDFSLASLQPPRPSPGPPPSRGGGVLL